MYSEQGFQKSRYDRVLLKIEQLPHVEVRKFSDMPGYERVMNALKDEYDKYTALAENRGLEEKGEVFQYLAHFPAAGHFLYRATCKISFIRSFRYDAVIKERIECTHKVNPFMQCQPCIRFFNDKAEKRLYEMNDALHNGGHELLVNTIPQAHPFEKVFKISEKTVTNQSQYCSLMETMRTICGLDVDGVKERDKMFQLRLRQQQLTTRGRIVNNRSHMEEWTSVGMELDNTAASIAKIDEKTKKALGLFKTLLHGPFEIVRACMGTPLELFTVDPRVRVLQEQLDTRVRMFQEQLEERNKYIAQLESTLGKEVKDLQEKFANMNNAPAPVETSAEIPAKTPTQTPSKKPQQNGNAEDGRQESESGSSSGSSSDSDDEDYNAKPGAKTSVKKSGKTPAKTPTKAAAKNAAKASSKTPAKKQNPKTITKEIKEEPKSDSESTSGSSSDSDDEDYNGKPSAKASVKASAKSASKTPAKISAKKPAPKNIAKEIKEEPKSSFESDDEDDTAKAPVKTPAKKKYKKRSSDDDEDYNPYKNKSSKASNAKRARKD